MWRMEVIKNTLWRILDWIISSLWPQAYKTSCVSCQFSKENPPLVSVWSRKWGKWGLSVWWRGTFLGDGWWQVGSERWACGESDTLTPFSLPRRCGILWTLRSGTFLLLLLWLWISTNTKWPRPRMWKWKIWHFKHLRSGSGLETWDHGRWQYKVPSPHEQIKQQSRERHRNISAPCSRQTKVLLFAVMQNKVAFGCCPCNRAHRGS